MSHDHDRHDRPRDVLSVPVPPTVRSVGLRDTVSQSLTMAYRGLVKVKHNPEQLFDVVLQPIIFTVMFTYIFGGAISGDVGSYLPIIIPGILVQTVITASIVTGTQLREDMDKGVFDRFKSLPIARISPLVGALLSDVSGTRSRRPSPSGGWGGSRWDSGPRAVSSVSCSRACS